VEFAAGGRALKLLAKDHELLRQLARIQSAAPEKLVEIAEKLSQERVALSRENELLQGRLLETEAAELFRCATETERAFIVCRKFSDRRLKISNCWHETCREFGVVAILGITDACRSLAAAKIFKGNCGKRRKPLPNSAAKAEGGGLAQAGGFPPLPGCLDDSNNAVR
jgi:alanyl-tRNA synthetase